MKNLWEKDRKTIFRELLSTYMEEGYNRKEAKKLASIETEEIMEEEAQESEDLGSTKNKDDEGDIRKKIGILAR